MDLGSSGKSAAEAYLAGASSEIVMREGVSLEEAEDPCIAVGHGLMAAAMASAPERLDASPCSSLPGGVRAHDRGGRTLATKMGDVALRYRRCRDAAGNTVVPLTDALDVPWGTRASPGASALLVCAGAEVPCLRSAHLLGMAGGSRASAATVMSMPHGVGAPCAEEDARAAEDPFSNGVLPDAETEVAEVCLEADGTWFRLQRVPEGEPGRVEVKALVAYRGKEAHGAKTARMQPVRHGCVGAHRRGSGPRAWPPSVRASTCRRWRGATSAATASPCTSAAARG